MILMYSCSIDLVKSSQFLLVQKSIGAQTTVELKIPQLALVN